MGRHAQTLTGNRVVTLRRFEPDQIKAFLVRRLGNPADAEEYYRLIDEIKDLLGLSEIPRMLSFIADLNVERLRDAKAQRGEITSAGLYQMLLDQWFDHELERRKEQSDSSRATPARCGASPSAWPPVCSRSPLMT